MEPVQVRTYAALPVNRAEVLRYARAGGEEPPLLDECLTEAARLGPYRVCWRRFDISDAGDALDLGFAKTAARGLRRQLEGCTQILLFAATAGAGLDRLVARYSRISPARAFLLDAVGTERVEALCDAFCADMEREYGPLRPRYSPGYGDLPLELQRDIIAALDCPRKIGLTLNESLLMTPAKSVTAIVGVGGGGRRNGCAGCGAEHCDYRCET